MSARRLYYVDWLRVIAVLLLFPYHTSRVFNRGTPFYVKGPEAPGTLDDVLGFVDAWHMPLLFFLAGASTFLAFRKRTHREYARERVLRLAIPFLFGVAVLIPPQTWYGARTNSGYGEGFLTYLWSGDFLDWNIQESGDYYGGFGIGHLWFILYLLLISFMALALFLPGRRRQALMQRTSGLLSRPAGWLVAGCLIMLAEGLPAVADKNLFYYFVFFVLGYATMVTGGFFEAAERHRWTALGVGVAVTAWWVASAGFRESLADPSLGLLGVNVLGMTGRWLVIVGLVGVGRRYLDRPSPALRYLAEGSYPIYILHQTVIVVLGFYVVGLGVAWPWLWLVLLLGSTALTLLAYEWVRRVERLRFLFGMRRRPVMQARSGGGRLDRRRTESSAV